MAHDDRATATRSGPVDAPAPPADKMITISLTLTPQQVRALTEKAKRHGLSMSAMLRVMLNRYPGFGG